MSEVPPACLSFNGVAEPVARRGHGRRHHQSHVYVAPLPPFPEKIGGQGTNTPCPGTDVAASAVLEGSVVGKRRVVVFC